MSIVTHPIFIERRTVSESHAINEIYLYINIYIQLAQEHLSIYPDLAANRTLKYLIQVIDISKKSTTSFDQRAQCLNVINSGVAFLNDLMGVG